MDNLFTNYIQSISSKFIHEETSEMGYRTDFEILIKGIFGSIKVGRIDHDAKAKQGNKPDFVVLNNDVPILYIEAKDIGVSLDKVEKSEQMTRYYGYTNLVLTDYVEFRFYRNGLRYDETIKIANYDIKNRTITAIPENYEHATKTLLDFAQSQKEPIRSGKHLSKIMGGRAQRIRDNVRQFLAIESERNTELVRVYEAIRKMLVHDLTPDAFADMYAQTLVYGLFVARYHDKTEKDFSRREAGELIPASNPLLQHFFDHIAGLNFDKRLEYIVNELCEVFSHANVKDLMSQYFKEDLWGERHEGPDPVIHFYEDFLKEYDPDLRKKLGAFYTPLPVVRFIVRSVDCLLEKEFGLVAGLADTSKTADGIHKVQILDPATGTGTFLAEVLDYIYKKFKNQGGRWPAYVNSDLLPRLHGFELMMAPYTIAHLKISMKLAETGFTIFNKGKRFGIYLTNSLEGGSVQSDLFTGFGFAESIAEESKEASKIKNDKPIMVVIGNPPYSISSSNKGKWILDLIKDYKKDLHEQKVNLDDDYIKFIRFAEHFIEKNKTGIVAMITNNSFIDGITHRQMRKHLLETFDDIYILDLHGNSKKKEKVPNGSKDENVFDIQQGVSINIFVRKNENKIKLGNVYHAELYGKREIKFEALNNFNMDKMKWQKLNYSEPYYFFVPKDFSLQEDYENGFPITDFFNIYSAGIKTKVDDIATDFSRNILSDRVNKILTNKPALKELIAQYNLGTNTTWEYEKASRAIFDESKIRNFSYRPFDYRFIYFDHDFLSRSRKKVMEHITNDNLALSFIHQGINRGLEVLVTKEVTCEDFITNHTFTAPLYLYDSDGSRIPNLKKEIVDEIKKIVGEFLPEDIFDYVYAVLHSPSYREKYKEFLKIDFPRVPYPKDKKQFEALVALGKELRELHLFESPKINQFITTYPVFGSNTVEKLAYQDGKVFINAQQYFGNVPEIAWNFYIGGYQPAQKWLKDRKGRTLLNADLEHYQKIIVALTETARIMKEIDQVYGK